jgi:hypothetical protein
LRAITEKNITQADIDDFLKNRKDQPPAKKRAVRDAALDDLAEEAEQAALAPAQVLESLRRGNERFAAGNTHPRDILHDQRVTAAGQYPHAVILSCIDSRAPAEIIFDAGLGMPQKFFAAALQGLAALIDRDRFLERHLAVLQPFHDRFELLDRALEREFLDVALGIFGHIGFPDAPVRA